MPPITIELKLVCVLVFCTGFAIGAVLNIVATFIIVMHVYDQLIGEIWPEVRKK